MATLINQSEARKFQKQRAHKDWISIVLIDNISAWLNVFNLKNSSSEKLDLRYFHIKLRYVTSNPQYHTISLDTRDYIVTPLSLRHTELYCQSPTMTFNILLHSKLRILSLILLNHEPTNPWTYMGLSSIIFKKFGDFSSKDVSMPQKG